MTFEVKKDGKALVNGVEIEYNSYSVNKKGSYKKMEHFSEEFPDDLVVVLGGTPPTVARMVNWKDGTARMVKVIPKSMWPDYFNRRIGHPKPLGENETAYKENV